MRKRAEQLVLGDPIRPTTDVGPVIDARVARAHRRDGAGGGRRRRDGRDRRRTPSTSTAAPAAPFYAPTILAGVKRDHRIARDEVFGPVLVGDRGRPLRRGDRHRERQRVRALGRDLHRDINDAMRATQRIDTGIVYVNAPTIGAEIHLPFGGTKHTGNGYREAGRRGLEQFSETKTVYIDFSGRLQRAQIDNRPRSRHVMNGAEAMAHGRCADAGVDIVFGLPGVHNLALWPACDAAGIRIVGMRHEQGCAYAADGYARATGKLGVALVTTGPGAANTVGAVGEAWASRSPVVVIATDIATTLRRAGAYRGVLHECTDQAALFGPVTKARTDRSVRGRDRGRRSRRRVRPVYVGIPTDLLDR